MMKSNLRTILMTTLLAGSSLAMPMHSGWAATSVEAKSSWAVSRVASISQGSYCTMAQKYGNNSILSFARNVNGEYSLALDFQSPVFGADGEETLTLQPAGGTKQSFKVAPQNQQVVVIGLGNDEEFFKQLDKSGSLTISYSGGDIDYRLEKFKDGRGELAVCLSGLNKKNSPAPAVDATEQEVAENAASVTPAAAPHEPSVEGLLSARPTPSMGSEPISSTQTSVPVGKVEVEEEPAAMPAPAPEKQVIVEQKIVEVPTADPEQMRKLQELKIENVQLKRALAESRQAFENQQAEAQGAAVGELREKLSSAETENKALKDQLATLEKAQKEPHATPQKQGAVEKFQADAQRMNQQIETLKAENTTLRNQLELASTAAASTAAPAVVANGNNSQEIEEYKNKLATLTSENHMLQSQLADARKAVSQPVTASDDDNDLKRQMRSLNTQIDTLRAEKEVLQSNYEKLQKDSESGQLKTVGGNWDLEQATRRYQESQREIRRLGALLDEERAKCSVEKKELESMLFDPEIAKGAQIAKLDNLQSQVTQKEVKIKEMEVTLAQLQAQASPEKDKEIESLKSSLEQAQAARKQQEELKGSMAALQSEVSAREAKIKEMEAQLASLRQSTVATTSNVSEKETQLIALRGQMAEKEAKIAELQSALDKTKLSAEQAQLAQSSAASNNALVATLKEELTSKSSQLGETEAKLAQANAQLAQLQAQSQVQTQSQSIQAASSANLQAQLAQGQQRISQLETQIKMMQQAPSPASNPAQQAFYVQPAYGTENASSTNGINFPSIQTFSSLLKSAGVPVKGDVSEISGGDPSSYKAYSWKTDSLYGSIEMRKADGVAAFDNVVSQYLARAKSRCNGEFAAVPSSVKAQGTEKSTSYEIACVGQGSSSSASILFTLNGGIVSTIAHEGRAEAMELAIDARDKIARSYR